ncbi:MAG: zinc-ribbon domain-containing protein, partial [Gammaproteobacteria bacterium]|nr:zinc-ribbon domain-containing protein [Gammaproteobacteria bacterium]
MLPGPTHIVRCPRCQQLGKYETISSGNTIGATYYTDGKRVAPMLPDMPSVVACSHCGGVFWRSQANDVGSYDTFSTRAGAADPAWLAAPHLQEPDEAEYFAWMEALLQEDPKRERELRLFAWWRGNDRHRRRGLQEAPVVGE